MPDLRDSIDGLRELDRIRNTATTLREQGLRFLRIVKTNTPGADIATDVDELTRKFCQRWTSSGTLAELALLVKGQNHYQPPADSLRAGDNKNALLEQLKEGVTIERLLPIDLSDKTESVPVLLAARTLSTLAVLPETVFSKTSMICYYRIVRELYYADFPDWTVGGARSGDGGRASAFITGECIRAIMALEVAVRRTFQHLGELLSFFDKHSQLSSMLKGIAKGKNRSLREWASHAFRRMWLDWYISTHQRNRTISMDTGHGPPTSCLENLDSLTESQRNHTFNSLLGIFKTTFERELTEIELALAAIEHHRREEIKTNKELGERTVSAHLKAFNVLGRVKQNAIEVLEKLNKAEQAGSLRQGLVDLRESFRSFPGEIHRVLEPATTYVDSVLDRELSLAHAGNPFDAGELIFAATSYGAVTKWQDNEKLRRACEHLITVLPDNGRFTTDRAYHADKRGYKRFPIACEMTRSFAKLLHRSGYEFDQSVARRMIRVFLNDKQFFRSTHEQTSERCVGWNFENAPDFDRPCIWVTAVTVQALDRVVRMLDSRINDEVFQHFKVITPEGQHKLTLNELVYPDHGIVSQNYTKRSIANRLEQMRAHIMRVPLNNDSSYLGSAILYGPPGTGKTSLLVALAASAKAPLVMLSPSDLNVQGQEQIEARARAVFEGLSMLTQAVILLDEFEPVLYNRSPKSNQQQRSGPKSNEQQREVPAMLKFLVTGMLPKLRTLDERGRKQSLIYCLATNHLEEIDEAAKREGRFDINQPVFTPDPLSRAGTFLFAFQRTAGASSFPENEPERDKRIAKIVAATAFSNAGDLAEKFKVDRNNKNLYFDYLMGDDRSREIEEEIALARRRLKKMEAEDGNWDPKEVEIRNTLLQFERQLLGSLSKENFDLDTVLEVPEGPRL